MSKLKPPSGNFLLFSGIALVVLGIFAIISPVVAGTAVVYLIGVLLLVTGVVHLIASLREVAWASRLSGIVLGAITGLAGITVLAHPFYGLSSLALVLSVFFVIEGIWKMVASFAYRPAPGWIGLLLSGILGLLLGIMIWNQWPLSGLWAVGVMVGIDLLSTGGALIALAMTMKQALSELRETV